MIDCLTKGIDYLPERAKAIPCRIRPDQVYKRPTWRNRKGCNSALMFSKHENRGFTFFRQRCPGRDQDGGNAVGRLPESAHP